MSTAFIWKTHNKIIQQEDNPDQINWSRNIKIDKFALHIFNCVVYNGQISKFLVINILLSLLKYCTSEKILIKVNMKAFQLYFSKIIFQDAEYRRAVKRFISFEKFIIMPTLVFDNYYYQGTKLQLYFFHDYIKLIFYVKYNIIQKDEILFDKHHFNLLSKKLQQFFIILKCNTLIALDRLLSINKCAKDAIKAKYFKIDAWQNNIALVLLALFVP